MNQAIEGVRWTIYDLEVLPENEWTRYEIINGELFVTPTPHRRHQQVCGKIFRQLDVWSDSSGLGETIVAPGVIFSQANSVIPDVVWVSRERLAQIEDEAGINAQVALENGKLVDQSTAQNPANLTFKTTTKDTNLTEAYDDLKVNAILNEIAGKNSRGTTKPGTPAIFGMNFQALSVAQKDASSNGGIATDGTPSSGLINALEHTDASIGKIINTLKQQGKFDSTLIVLTAKHGQNPRLGTATLIPENTFTDALTKAGITVNQATQDDVALVWLKNQSQASTATTVLKKLANPAIDTVYSAG